MHGKLEHRHICMDWVGEEIIIIIIIMGFLKTVSVVYTLSFVSFLYCNITQHVP